MAGVQGGGGREDGEGSGGTAGRTGPWLLRVGAACACHPADATGEHPGPGAELSCAQPSSVAEVWLASSPGDGSAVDGCPEGAALLEPYQLAPDGTPAYPLSLVVQQPHGPISACLSDDVWGETAGWGVGPRGKEETPAPAAAVAPPLPLVAWTTVWAVRAAFSSAAAACVAALLRRAGP